MVPTIVILIIGMVYFAIAAMRADRPQTPVKRLQVYTRKVRQESTPMTERQWDEIFGRFS